MKIPQTKIVRIDVNIDFLFLLLLDDDDDDDNNVLRRPEKWLGPKPIFIYIMGFFFFSLSLVFIKRRQVGLSSSSIGWQKGLCHVRWSFQFSNASSSKISKKLDVRRQDVFMDCVEL